GERRTARRSSPRRKSEEPDRGRGYAQIARLGGTARLSDVRRGTGRPSSPHRSHGESERLEQKLPANDQKARLEAENGAGTPGHPGPEVGAASVCDEPAQRGRVRSDDQGCDEWAGQTHAYPLARRSTKDHRLDGGRCKPADTDRRDPD